MPKVIQRKKWYFVSGLLLFLLLYGGKVILDNARASEDGLEEVSRASFFYLSDDGGSEILLSSFASTVGEALEEKDISLGTGDEVFPSFNEDLSSGMHISIDRMKTITLSLEGKKEEIQTTVNTARELLLEEKIQLGEDDFILPDKEAFLQNEAEIEVVRVEVVEEKEYESLAYKTLETKDDELGWRERKVTQKGVEGEKELVYKVVYHNDEEVKRTLLETSITKEPITQEITQGTYVKLGKKHTGLGTWYAHTGTMAAASPWLPLGSYAKVTNTANGKSVMVKINDRGPFGENRIIDLDKVAFQEIASIGAGVIEVKVEEVKN